MTSNGDGNKIQHAVKKGCNMRGARGQAKNYRSVVLTSHITKTLERIVRKRLMNYLMDGNKLNPGQYR